MTVTVHHKQYEHYKNWEQEVLETIKLGANGPEFKKENHIKAVQPLSAVGSAFKRKKKKS